jgi:predicted DNA-binding ribbon-helix-helix protein
MIRTQIQLTEEQVQQLKDISQAENLSVAELVRRAVDHWLVTAAPLTVAERRERSLKAIGQFSSGLSDLAINHDKYLSEGKGTW